MNKTKIVLEDGEQKIAQDQFQPNQESQGKNNLSKVEGVITSAIQIKHELETHKIYCYAFFQLEGLNQDIENLLLSKRTSYAKAFEFSKSLDIPVVFKLDSSINPDQQTPPAISPKSKVLLEGH